MEKRLKSEILRVKKILESKPDEWYYWYGYSIGLEMDTDEKIESWVESENKTLKDIYKGFKNAVEWRTAKVESGRPKFVEVWLNRLGVTKHIDESLLKISQITGKSIPDIRREAYEQYIQRANEDFNK